MSDQKYYWQYTDMFTSVEQRRKWNIGDIWINKIKCLKCNDEIQSNNRHDMKWCKCGSVAIDGGSMYQRIMGDFNNIEDLSIMYNELDKD